VADALPIAYLDGEYLPLREARISPLDRGFLFGDAVYEVVPFFAGKPALLDEHIARLSRSLAALGIAEPADASQWRALILALAERNGGGNLVVYLQVSRGADTGRAHLPPAGLRPTVFGMASPIPAYQVSSGIRAITLPDQRWARCDIKATSLLANVMASGEAHAKDAEEALLLRDGEVTEGGSSSVLIVENGGLLRRANSQAILPGTTTDLVVRLAAAEGVRCQDARITQDRLRKADEIWITSAGRGVVPVIQLDGQPVGDGRPGPVYNRVASRFKTYIDEL
jgi:D-alanine transaminase